MKKIILLFIATALLNVNSYGQGASIDPSILTTEKLAEMKKMTLLVLVMELNEDLLSKHYKKDVQNLEVCKRVFKMYNNTVEEFVSKNKGFWKDVEYSTFKDLYKIDEAKRAAMLLLAPYGNKVIILEDNMGWGMLNLTEEICKNHFYHDAFVDAFMQNYTKGQYIKGTPVMVKIGISGFINSVNPQMTSRFSQTNLPNTDKEITIEDIRFSLNQLVNAVNDYEMRKEAIPVNDPLRTKTLVLCKDNLSEKIGQTELTAVYKGSFKIVTKAEFDSLSIIDDGNNIFLRILVSSAINNAQFINGDPKQGTMGGSTMVYKLVLTAGKNQELVGWPDPKNIETYTMYRKRYNEATAEDKPKFRDLRLSDFNDDAWWQSDDFRFLDLKNFKLINKHVFE